MNTDSAQFRLLPSIDELLQSVSGQRLVAAYSRVPAISALRASLDEARAAIRAGQPCPPIDALLNAARTRLEQEQRPHLRMVINATG
ncbi:MAG TPA: L-seryl-tRNA(Sec) selenium transferase, partial [Ktedonobacteraceae bacterium]|nr:L-seryl-tRNA(Sec) selenium transferase [Ktedonobacteraceae bacterium]